MSDLQVPSLYSKADVEFIFHAYRHIFGDADEAVFDYLGFRPRRAWSHLTTDFRSASYEQCLELHLYSESLHTRGLPPSEEAELLKKKCSEVGAGYSLGICPWTDNLLFESFRTEKSDIVMVIGHDWYPIAAGRLAESGLYVAGLHHTPKYQRWCPEAFFDAADGPVVLFMNLYPDFRPPGSKKTGPLPAVRELSYSDCVKGITAAIRAVEKRYQSVKLVSWGVPAWSALVEYVTAGVIAKGLKQQASRGTGQPLTLFGLEYLPLAHPSFASNQNKAHLVDGYDAMRLGSPLFASSLKVKPRCF